MKTALRLSIYILLFSGIVNFFACDGEESTPDKTQMIEKTWSLSSTGYIKQMQTDVSANYNGFAITFKSDGTYITSNAKKLFYPSGTWSWVPDTENQIFLDGSFPVTVNTLSASTLEFALTINRDNVNVDGRQQSVFGDYKFLLTGN